MISIEWPEEQNPPYEKIVQQFAALQGRAEAAESRASKAEAERDDARVGQRQARRLIADTHKNAVKHESCEHEFCPICQGGLFVCADCGAAEVEAEERVCSTAESRITALEARERQMREALLSAREYFDGRADADQPTGSAPIPNDEMRLLVEIDTALKGQANGRS